MREKVEYEINEDTRHLWKDLIKNMCLFRQCHAEWVYERESHKGKTLKWHNLDKFRKTYNELCHYIARLLCRAYETTSHDFYSIAWEVAIELQDDPYHVSEYLEKKTYIGAEIVK